MTTPVGDGDHVPGAAGTVDELAESAFEDLDEPTPSDTELALRRLADIVRHAKNVPLSASAMIDRDEVLDLVDHALGHLPEEIRQARWLLKERDDYLARVRREGDDLLEAARTRAERMVQRTEVVKAAESRARQIVDAAEADARKLRNEVEDFCDQKLGSFEIVLQRTMKMVSSGREKLQGGRNGLGESAEPSERVAERNGAPRADGARAEGNGQSPQAQSQGQGAPPTGPLPRVRPAEPQDPRRDGFFDQDRL